jgi:hypothetical protein
VVEEVLQTLEDDEAHYAGGKLLHQAAAPCVLGRHRREDQHVAPEVEEVPHRHRLGLRLEPAGQAPVAWIEDCDRGEDHDPLVGGGIPAECNTPEHKKGKGNERTKVHGEKLGTVRSGVNRRFCNHRRPEPEDNHKTGPPRHEPSQPPVQSHVVAHYQQDLRG